MRKLPLMGWFACVAVGLFLLYEVSYRVQALEDDIDRIGQQVASEQESTHVLKAEWTYLTRPERLQALAEKHGRMGPIDPVHMVSLSDVPLDDLSAIAPVPSVRKPLIPTRSAQEKITTETVTLNKPKAPAIKETSDSASNTSNTSLWDAIELEGEGGSHP